jgi:hypothetical protein
VEHLLIFIINLNWQFCQELSAGQQDKCIEIPMFCWGCDMLSAEGPMAKKNAKIIEIREMVGETGRIIMEQEGSDPLRELGEIFGGIEDKRFEPYVEHLLPDIVMITLLAVMARANEWNEMSKGSFPLIRPRQKRPIPV